MLQNLDSSLEQWEVKQITQCSTHILKETAPYKFEDLRMQWDEMRRFILLVANGQGRNIEYIVHIRHRAKALCEKFGINEDDLT